VHKNKLFYENSIEIKGQLIGADPLVMGIINLTPDSFYAGSRKQTENEILNEAEKMLKQGASLLDLGAYSSRPNATHISEEEEWHRLEGVIEKILRLDSNCIVSVDTFRSGIAEKCLDAGAAIINDISAGMLDDQMFKTIAKYPSSGYIMMHMRGNPSTMQSLTDYVDIKAEIHQYFEEKIAQLTSLHFHNILVDLGFGFSKTLSQNFELLANLEHYETLKRPMLIGVSRKSMIYKTLQIEANEALNGSTALHMYALEKGAKILRVHDVKEAVECVNLWKKLNQYA
jgi:dihydropteroate synthase